MREPSGDDVTPPAVGALGSGGQESRVDLLANVAEMYYVDGLEQREIAEQIGLSRSNVSRLLTEARRRGIVEIRIRRPLGRSRALEEELAGTFGIADARVLASRPAHDAETALAEVGALAARLLLEQLDDGQTVGLSWGTSLEALVAALQPRRAYSVDVVQLLGGLSWVTSSLSGDRLGQRLADALGGRFTPMLAPATIVSRALADEFLRQPGVADVIDRGRQADIALVGIGSYTTGSARKLFESAQLTAAERREIDRAGAVGDICARLYTIEGEICNLKINDRIAAIGLEALRAIPSVVGIARGVDKTDGIVGALRGRLIDVLVTDEATALAVLDRARRADG
jgi:DNA-binding transcriptional regulator LsrR (DeoR family)